MTSKFQKQKHWQGRFWIVSIIVLVISTCTTAYFGWNWLPLTHAEWRIDIILSMIMGINIGVAFMRQDRENEREKNGKMWEEDD